MLKYPFAVVVVALLGSEVDECALKVCAGLAIANINLHSARADCEGRLNHHFTVNG